MKDIDASGYWLIEACEPPEGREHASKVHFRVEYDADSVNPSSLDLPRLVSLSWVVEKVKPVIEREGQRVVERVVADVEGERRHVDLDIETS